ncbi:hypothetical protein GLOIN_2v1784175 [Rhizophagus clarus]|uniref:Uncharacterized protein n=1 Tax=Rhizophagus clarus TaxID=94130 RepID=A0A8H3QGV1_9GLOM|nr:hypothetical protein GLOIN_2v1784175 [Rhizophagus clarus]
MFQSSYPASNILKINQNSTYYIYNIIKKGFYPSNDILCYTSARSSDQFKIPDDYMIHTSWGKGISQHMIRCEISYVESVPVFKIWLSGVHVFGLNLQELEKEHERKQNSRLLKPFNKLSNSMKTKRVHAFSEHLTVDFKNTAISCFHPNDYLNLQEICFAVQEKTFKANFGIQDMEKKN